MEDQLRRLLRTGAAYQVSDLAAKVIALATLPLYTRYVSRAEYGAAEVLFTLVILVSIVIRLGIGEAFVRRWFLDEDPERRLRVARTATGFLLATTTIASLVVVVAAAPISELVLGREDTALLLATTLGLWAFTNIELALALLRVEERARDYLVASLLRVALTVAITVVLVVVLDEGAQGLLLGTYVATAVVLFGLWWLLRDRLGFAPGRVSRAELPGMLRFGLPTVPAEVSLFALSFVDRLYLFRVESEETAGVYSLALKLATGVSLFVRGFQYAWPPLAYSVTDDREAARLYARVATYYVLTTGLVVAALTLLGRWFVQAFAAPAFYEAHEALPWLALGWALYGLMLVLVSVAGRAQVTTRNFPATLAGLAANVVALVVLVPPLGIAGAGVALCVAYLVMLAAMHLLTRRLFEVSFEWGRLGLLVAVIGGIAVAGELLLPDSGLAGFATRSVVLAAIPALIWVLPFASPGERDGVLGGVRRIRGRRWG